MSYNLKAVIIDDEPKGIDLLVNYCNRTPNIKVEKTFRNPMDAISFTKNNMPDVLFLDINMPTLSGIQLAKIVLGEVQFVFTTAYSKFAVESYELNATDYLLKPISYRRFLDSVKKVEDLISSKNKSYSNTQTLIIKSGNTKHIVNIDEILYLEKDGNYMYYHFEDKKILARENISKALEKLPESFVQVHKSYIVALRKIQSLDTSFISLIGIKIPIGKRFKAQLLKSLNSDRW